MSDIYNETLLKLSDLLVFSIAENGELIVTFNDKVYVVGEIGMERGGVWPSYMFDMSAEFIAAICEVLDIKDAARPEAWLLECVHDLLLEEDAMGGRGDGGLDVQIEAFFACRPWLKNKHASN